MQRHAVAFFSAPLAVPLFTLPWVLSGHLAAGWILTATVITALVSCAGTLALGMPAYFFLRARGLTTFWIAGIIGFVIGAFMWLVFSVLFPLSLDQGLPGVRFALTDLRSLKGVLWPGGVLGAIVGSLFWVIARPDRQSSWPPGKEAPEDRDVQPAKSPDGEAKRKGASPRPAERRD
ncbi:hypothetical protein [Mesorhizobium sp. AA23]|uniref:hypothetical protein n=1 Tax=Mesorhizobium sp. AA23 TaxID=1854058 RepID=UPI0012EAD70E|nr:hypothetical protein [Mesorhizobium sp. AA23]